MVIVNYLSDCRRVGHGRGGIPVEGADQKQGREQHQSNPVDGGLGWFGVQSYWGRDWYYKYGTCR